MWSDPCFTEHNVRGKEYGSRETSWAMVQVREDGDGDKGRGQNGQEGRDSEHTLVVEPRACWWMWWREWGQERNGAWVLGFSFSIWENGCAVYRGRKPGSRSDLQKSRPGSKKLSRLAKFIHLVCGARIHIQICPTQYNESLNIMPGN